MENQKDNKLKILCLHGFRTSGSFLQKQLSKWDASILSQFDMDFPDGKFPAGGKSDIEGIFPPPYFEWFQFEKDFTEYTNLDECISYLCDYITSKGPFDGLLGFSQGATLCGLLLGYQAQGKLLKEHPTFRFFISISGAKFRQPSICEIAYKEKIKAKSVHFIGAKDWLKLPSEELASEFHNPLIIRHPQGHTVPRLDDVAIQQLREWTKTIIQSNTETTTIAVTAPLPPPPLDSNDELKNGEAKAPVGAASCNKVQSGQLESNEEIIGEKTGRQVEAVQA